MKISYMRCMIIYIYKYNKVVLLNQMKKIPVITRGCDHIGLPIIIKQNENSVFRWGMIL